MELKPCPDCGHKVSPSAIACPNCGKNFRVTEQNKVFYVMVIVVVAFLILRFALLYLIGVDILPQTRR